MSFLIHRARLASILLIMTAATLGCSAASDDEGDDTGALESEGAKAPEDLVAKLGESAAVREAKVGVHSWVSYGILTTRSELGIMALGTDRDGSLTAVMHLDLGTGTLLAFEKTTRDGLGTRRADPSLRADYAAEMAAIVSRVQSATQGGIRTQRMLSAGDRASACIISALGPTMLAVGAFAAFTAVAGGILTLPVAVVMGAAIGVTPMAGGAAATILNADSVTVAVVFKGIENAGRLYVNAVSECVSGEG